MMLSFGLYDKKRPIITHAPLFMRGMGFQKVLNEHLSPFLAKSSVQGEFCVKTTASHRPFRIFSYVCAQQNQILINVL